MRGGFTLILAAALTTYAGAATEPSAGQRKLSERLQAALASAQHRDCRSSLVVLREAIAQPEFATAVEPARAGVYGLAALCAAEMKDSEAAYRYAQAGTHLKGANAQLWRIRLGIEVTGQRYPQAIDTVEAMAAQNGEALNAIPLNWLAAVNRGVERDLAQRRRLLTILTTPSYHPDELLVTGDLFKRDYAGLLIATGDKAAAAALVARIEDPSVLVDVSVDPRLRDMLPKDFDARAAIERRLAQAREVAASHAGSIAAVLQIARYLRVLGRVDEALATLEAASPEGATAKTFTDLDEQRNWWWDGIARTYQMLGRYDDAVRAFRHGIDAGEGGMLNVSQTLNLGYAQLRFSRAADALATVAAFEKQHYPASPYGEMVLRFVRGCALAASGEGEAAKADIAYAAMHEHDNPGAFTDLLLCAGDLDGAAAATIRRLDDADRRAAMLLELSDYDEPPPTYPKAPEARRLPALKARPDVQAALARAGGTRRFHFQYDTL